MDAKHAFNLTQRGGREGAERAGTVEESARKRGGDCKRARWGERGRTQTGHRMSACLDNNDL